jgi:hypothetical protein
LSTVFSSSIDKLAFLRPKGNIDEQVVENYAYNRADIENNWEETPMLRKLIPLAVTSVLIITLCVPWYTSGADPT